MAMCSLAVKPRPYTRRLMLDFGLFDAFADFDFLLPGEQRHLAHLVHVHPHRIVQDFQPRIFLFLGFRRFCPFDFRMVHDFDVEIAQFCVEFIEVLGCQAVRQHVINIVVSDMTVLLGQMEQGFDGLGHIRRLDRLIDHWSPLVSAWVALVWAAERALAAPLGGSEVRNLLWFWALCEMTKRRYGRCALVEAGLPRGRPRRPAPSADLFSFLFSINNKTRVSPFSSVIFAGHPMTTLHHWNFNSDCPLRRLKTANTRRLTRIQNTLFHRMLNYATICRAGGLNASKPDPNNRKRILLPNPGAARKQKEQLFLRLSMPGEISSSA